MARIAGFSAINPSWPGAGGGAQSKSTKLQTRPLEFLRKFTHVLPKSGEYMRSWPHAPPLVSASAASHALRVTLARMWSGADGCMWKRDAIEPPSSSRGEAKQFVESAPGAPQGWIHVSPMSFEAQWSPYQPWRMTCSEPSLFRSWSTSSLPLPNRLGVSYAKLWPLSLLRYSLPLAVLTNNAIWEG